MKSAIQQFNGTIVKATHVPQFSCIFCLTPAASAITACFRQVDSVRSAIFPEIKNSFWCLYDHISSKMGRVILEYIRQLPSSQSQPTVTDNYQKGPCLTGAASYTAANKITFFCTILLPLMLHHLAAIKMPLSALPLSPLLPLPSSLPFQRSDHFLTRSPVVLLTCFRLSRSTSVN